MALFESTSPGNSHQSFPELPSSTTDPRAAESHRSLLEPRPEKVSSPMYRAI